MLIDWQRFLAQVRNLKKVGLGFIFSLMMMGLWTGCSPQVTQASLPGTNSPPQWNWEFYGQVPRMRMASLQCQILPKSSITIHSPLVGKLHVYVDHPQTNLPIDFIWAEFEPEMFAAESNALQEASRKLEEREKFQMEIEFPREKMKLASQIEEAERQLGMLEMASTNQALFEAIFSPGPLLGSSPGPDVVEKSGLNLRLLKRSMEFLSATNLISLGIDLEGQWSELERRKLEFERRQKAARLKMPFQGQLTVNLPLTEGVEEYPVNSGQEIGVVRDLSQIRVRVPISNPAWVGLSPERITAVIRLPTGEELHAPFAFKKIERMQFREESVYYFEVSPAHSERAARLLGTDVACELWVTLPRPARIVPKLALVLHYPEAFQTGNWAEGVDAAWPGAKVLVEGQTALAVVLPHDA